MPLPQPTYDGLAHSRRVVEHIQREIAASGGWISFARFMELALYAPGLGYYSAGTAKLGVEGDFVTAPEISPYFGRTLARPIGDCLRQIAGNILELGAGSGRLALDILSELHRRGSLPAQYFILAKCRPICANGSACFHQHAPQFLHRLVHGWTRCLRRSSEWSWPMSTRRNACAHPALARSGRLRAV
jgi:hypothetical protein